MNRFRTSTESQAVVPAPREEIWAVLTDPDLLTRFTPFLANIEADGDHWRWEMSKLPVLGISVAPSFTERMVFDELHRIDYIHEPPPGAVEHAGVNGWYVMKDAGEGTHLSISLGVEVELPLARIAAPAVQAAMKGVVLTMGHQFSANLMKHLGVEH